MLKFTEICDERTSIKAVSTPSKLSAVCYSFLLLMQEAETLTSKTIYYAYFHLCYYELGAFLSLFGYFLTPKTSDRIMKWKTLPKSCKPLFKSPGILTLSSTYILVILKFVTLNGNLFVTNGELHDHISRNQMILKTDKDRLSRYVRSMNY